MRIFCCLSRNPCTEGIFSPTMYLSVQSLKKKPIRGKINIINQCEQQHLTRVNCSTSARLGYIRLLTMVLRDHPLWMLVHITSLLLMVLKFGKRCNASFPVAALLLVTRVGRSKLFDEAGTVQLHNWPQ